VCGPTSKVYIPIFLSTIVPVGLSIADQPSSQQWGIAGSWQRYLLHAIAHNKAGTAFDLGTKTIIVDNFHAAKPFGTIDTPGQGETISAISS